MDLRSVKSNHSFIETIAQLNIGGRGVINKLPNEMLLAILRRVQAHHLIRLRSVDKRWKVLIEDICRDKKCLMIMNIYDEDFLSALSTRFNGHLKLNNDFVFIKLKYNPCEIHLSAKLCTLLVKLLFPRIEQFLTNLELFNFPNELKTMLEVWSLTSLSLALGFFYSRANEFCEHINRLVNLKKLDITFPRGMAERLAPALARLEHFSSSDLSLTVVVPYLGTGVTSLGIDYSDLFPYVTIAELTKWHRLSASSISSLVRFSLCLFDPRVLAFICEHFSSLQMLTIDMSCCMLTIEMTEQLAQLTHLTELRIDHIYIHLATLNAANLVPLANVRTLSLVDFWFPTGGPSHGSLPPNLDVLHFGRVLSIIFPNVEKLMVKSRYYPAL